MVGVVLAVFNGVRTVAGGAAARAAERTQHGAQHAPAPVLQRVRRVAFLILAVVLAERAFLGQEKASFNIVIQHSVHSTQIPTGLPGQKQ